MNVDKIFEDALRKINKPRTAFSLTLKHKTSGQAVQEIDTDNMIGVYQDKEGSFGRLIASNYKQDSLIYALLALDDLKQDTESLLTPEGMRQLEAMKLYKKLIEK